MTNRRSLSSSSTVQAHLTALQATTYPVERSQEGPAPSAAHPWAIPEMELATALGIAAGLAVGDHPVFVHPRASMPIDQVRLLVTPEMYPPGTMVLVVETPRLDTVTRVMTDIARRRATEPDLANVIVVTPASPVALEQALRAAGHPHPEIAVVQATSAAVGEMVRQDRSPGRQHRGALPEGNTPAL